MEHELSPEMIVIWARLAILEVEIPALNDHIIKINAEEEEWKEYDPRVKQKVLDEFNTELDNLMGEYAAVKEHYSSLEKDAKAKADKYRERVNAQSKPKDNAQPNDEL